MFRAAIGGCAAVLVSRFQGELLVDPGVHELGGAADHLKDGHVQAMQATGCLHYTLVHYTHPWKGDAAASLVFWTSALRAMQEGHQGLWGNQPYHDAARSDCSISEPRSICTVRVRVR